MATFMEKIGLIIFYFLLCDSTVDIDQDEVSLNADVPYLSAWPSKTVELKCCFKAKKQVTYTWIKQIYFHNKTMSKAPITKPITVTNDKLADTVCGNLTWSVKVTDSGFYQCLLRGIQPELYTHGTFLLVYKPMTKTINISENAKNHILTAEGILLLLCVLLPSATLLFKSKRVNSLEKKKAKKEEENIYQGLNLDDCCTTYDQIERSQAQGPYQDVCNIIEEEEDIQLEKP